MGVEVSSRTRGKLILNKSQLSAQQTHQLGVLQVQPQMSLKLDKPHKKREYELRSKGKINVAKTVGEISAGTEKRIKAMGQVEHESQKKQVEQDGVSNALMNGAKV